ncbi:hypothetical protein [Marinisporobacter balticus]|uniref:Uncharacterized protein n=1 Tax=Marinisporobacter balticus TaxID=2018667 RepID=A0A4R2KFA8_9FIRM|nr:hypothetical protein [Marinisporobacter balticus]TCO72253.1 hypothetical protein EV214_1183 [Marinisporobacter balticus]
MGLGFGNNYFLKMNELLDVKISVEDVLQNKYTGDRDAYFGYIKENFGLDALKAEEKGKIEKTMDMVDKGTELGGNEYGGYGPVAIELYRQDWQLAKYKKPDINMKGLIQSGFAFYE